MSRANQFTDIGVTGRKTGITISNARRDELGMEDLDAYFPSPKRRNIDERTQSQTETMDLESGMASNMSKSARRKSPAKTHLKSPALRLLSAQRADERRVSGGGARKSFSSPSVARRLDFSVELQADEGEDEQDVKQDDDGMLLVNNDNDGMLPVDNDYDDSMPIRGSPLPKSPSESKVKAAAKSKAKQNNLANLSKGRIQAKTNKTQRARRETSSVPPERKSARTRMPPLDFWRNERVIYSLNSLRQPQIRDVVRIDEPTPLPTRSYPKSKRSRSRAPKSTELEESSLDEDEGREEIVLADVIDYTTGDEHQRVIAQTAGSVHPRLTLAKNFKFANVFKEEGYAASGVVELQPKQRKPPKPTHHNLMIFYVISGKVQVGVHTSNFRLARGDHFLVPRGNTYEIVNVGKTTATILFLQSTDTAYNLGLDSD